MITRIDKAIAAGVSSGGLLYGYAQASGDPKHYGLAAAIAVGLAVGLFTFIVPNKAASA